MAEGIGEEHKWGLGEMTAVLPHTSAFTQYSHPHPHPYGRTPAWEAAVHSNTTTDSGGFHLCALWCEVWGDSAAVHSVPGTAPP